MRAEKYASQGPIRLKMVYGSSPKGDTRSVRGKSSNSQEVTSNTKSACDDQSQRVERRITLSESVDVLRGVLDILRSGEVVGVDGLLRVRLGPTVWNKVVKGVNRQTV